MSIIRTLAIIILQGSTYLLSYKLADISGKCYILSYLPQQQVTRKIKKTIRTQFSPAKANSLRGVGFFQQFTRQFLRPYGKADKTPSTETVFKRVKPFTCEWLLRPKVALSELSETVSKNIEILTNKDQKIVVNQIKPLRKPLKAVHKDSVSSASEKDVIDILKIPVSR